jgi:adenosylcobinamide-GDP ribazoletransferase
MPLGQLVAAFMLLSRLPVGRLARARGEFADSIWAYPLVGAAVGGIAAAVFAGCVAVGMPPAVAAAWTLAAQLLTTGALHEDGLADTADGLGGGRTRERKLEIMRDSRIGSFGALALALSLAARGTALALLSGPWRVAAGLVAAAALGRAAILVVLLALAPARPDGLAAGLGRRGAGRAAVGLALALAVAVLALPLADAVRAGCAALAAALAVAWLARRQVGGYTGDILGAAAVVAECAALAAGGGWRVSP